MYSINTRENSSGFLGLRLQWTRPAAARSSTVDDYGTRGNKDGHTLDNHLVMVGFQLF